LEFAGVRGPLWWAAEGFFFEGGVSGARRNFSGSDFQIGYYLTGEHRRYKTSAGAWDRQRPTHPVGSGGKLGAWEILARYSTVDLDDGPVRGGELSTFAVGLNWYPNSAVRLQLNYVRPDLEDVGQGEFVILRFGLEF
jgi:phosphate-selective porin OprO/OprP